MKNSYEKNDWRRELAQLSEQLRDPFRMRIAIAFFTVAVMFFAISEPLHGKTKKCRRELQQLRDKVKTAEEVLLLQESMRHVDSRIIQGQGNDAVTGFFIDLFRENDVRLLQINAETPVRLGPIYSVRVTLDMSGEFSELNNALGRLESQHQLVRVESIQITPAERGAATPMMQLSVRLLKEKA